MKTSAAAIFDTYHLAVYRYFRRLLGDREAAEDLTQEVFLRVIRGLDRYESLGRESAWVFRIARNVFFDNRRARRPDATRLGDIEACGVESDHVLAFDIQEALRLLSVHDCQVFVLKEVVGLSYAEIADATDVTENSVRSRLRRARLQLRASLRGRLVKSSMRDSGEGQG